MHIFSRKALLAFADKHPDVESALDHWYRVMKSARFQNFAELKATFGSADQVGDLTVFNISGNKVRLIVAIHYPSQDVYIRYILSHAEYDKNQWKE